MAPRVPYREEYLATGGILHDMSRNDSIYEDRLKHVYQLLAKYRPRMVLSCLSAESFELLRYVPGGVLRVGMVQADDPGVYQMVAHFTRWLDRMVGVSDSIRLRLAKMDGLGAERAVYIPYGITFPTVPPDTGGNPNRPLRVIYAGRLTEEQKRISRLAELVRQLADGSRQFEFTIVGGGDRERWLRSEIGDLQGVRFTGELGNAAVMECFANQDVFVLLSDYEGLPLSLLEAMGMGCVPVISDLESGIRDVVTPDCGIRVPVGDVGAAAAALRLLAADRKELYRLREAGIKKARTDYSSTRMAERYMELATTAPGNPHWKTRLLWIRTPRAIDPWWHYAQPVRSIRRFRKWLSRDRR